MTHAVFDGDAQCALTGARDALVWLRRAVENGPNASSPLRATIFLARHGHFSRWRDASQGVHSNSLDKQTRSL